MRRNQKGYAMALSSNQSFWMVDTRRFRIHDDSIIYNTAKLARPAKTLSFGFLRTPLPCKGVKAPIELPPWAVCSLLLARLPQSFGDMQRHSKGRVISNGEPRPVLVVPLALLRSTRMCCTCFIGYSSHTPCTPALLSAQSLHPLFRHCFAESGNACATTRLGNQDGLWHCRLYLISKIRDAAPSEYPLFPSSRALRATTKLPPSRSVFFISKLSLGLVTKCLLQARNRRGYLNSRLWLRGQSSLLVQYCQLWLPLL